MVQVVRQSIDPHRLKRIRKRQRRRRLVAALLSALVVVSCGLGLFVIAWYFSNELLRVTHQAELYDLTIRKVTPETVVITRSANTERQGVFGIDWPGGQAILGEIIASDATSITRKLLQTTAPLHAGLRVNWNVHVYRGTPDSVHGLTYEDAIVPGPLGDLPAWFVPGRTATWVLIVHGYKGNRREGLRVMPLLARLGFPMLDLTYRNDVESPASPDNFYHLGDHEWQDLEAGVQYALAHGAESIILYGWSMGGNIVQTFLRRSVLASRVRAIILDCPVLDWRLVLDKQARDRHLPEVLTTIVEFMLRVRAGLNLHQLDHISTAATLTVPTLLFHGVEDSLVPVALSDAFARARPDLVRYHRIEGASHTQEWNLDAATYEQALQSFLEETPGLLPEPPLEPVAIKETVVPKITFKKA